ncbi:uncharacterized protein EV422DRAFT_518870 [Fimicolochytrium jonesii]|uniref:uncharacterized protein n=1 Tax=Fimicolochytrium jonesii TaxID=1396493 RepID=UPI0022FE6040|nr:uncharacterized protein EV422DRAFT_518870 [Fimicolochytrium jonesii]KAI8824101.1 hypothetical protein EV422DRAFT_518870 [Fimicolochytrium jonesii]
MSEDSLLFPGIPSVVASVLAHSSTTPPIAGPGGMADLSITPPSAPIPWEESTGDEKRCWICFLEEDEEEPSKRLKWVRPCKCKNSLKYAHEDCLLKWIAEKQEPGNTDVKCPACGHVYAVDESRDVVLSVFSFVDGSIQSFVPYVTLAGMSMAFYVVSTTYGAYAVMTMCGPDHGEQILSEANWGWRTWVGLPLIPLGLVFSRLSSADAALPLLPFLVLGNDQIRLSFPPSPALTICLMPWVRLGYNAVWAKLLPFFRRAKANRSARAIPRPYAVNAGLAGAGEDDQEDGPLREVSVERRDGQRLVLGSLFLPAVSSMMGTLLGTIPWVRQKLPDPFHRNVLGGCLFILGKDVVSTIYRSQRRRQHRTRRVKEYRGD